MRVNGASAARGAGALSLAFGLCVAGRAHAQYPYPQAQPVQQQQQPYGQQSYGQQQQPYAPQQQYGQQPYGQQQQPAVRSSDDSGRGLEFFYARAGAAGALVSLGALGHDDNMRLKAANFGGAFELGVGLRLVVFTLGPRARLLALSSATLWQLGGEAAFHIPFGNFEPFVGLQGGATFGKGTSADVVCPASPAGCGPSEDPSISGGDVGLAGGADYYLSPQFSVGGAANVMMLFLSRKGVSGSADPGLASSASATSLGVTLGAHAAFHL